MSETISFKNWAPSGDLLTCLPGIKQVCDTTGKKAVIYQRLNVRPHYYDGAIYSVKNEAGEPVCMSNKQWGMLKPLLEAQEFIDHCEIYTGQSVDYNLDKIREGVYAPTAAGDLSHCQSLIFPEMATDLSVFRLDFSKEKRQGIGEEKILINLTPRYRNQCITYYFLRDYAEHLLFIGTEDEHMAFMKEYWVPIPRVNVDDFNDLAAVISECSFFLGNQSMCWHITELLAKPRMVEICLGFPNVWPHTPGPGLPYTTQENCEKIFKRLIGGTGK